MSQRFSTETRAYRSIPRTFVFGADPKDTTGEPLSSKHAVVFSGRTAAPLARSLCVGKDTQIVEIHDSGEAMDLAWLNTIRSMAFSGLGQATIVNGIISLRLLEALCEEFPGLTIEAILPRAIGWKSDGFRYLKSLILLQQRYSQLNLLSYGASMTAFLTNLGGRVVDVQLGLPTLRLRPKPGPITVLVSRGNGEIASQGHIAAAVALAKQRLGDRIENIVYEGGPSRVARILETFVGSSRVARILATFGGRAQTAYEAGFSDVGRILETFGIAAQKVPSLDQYLDESYGGPFVLVGPYPDGMTDSLALLALEKGGLALVAKGALPLTAPLERWLTIDYWEQSDLICDRLCELTSNYAAVQNLLIEPCGVHESDSLLLDSSLAQ
jgi:hypothetical protein